MSTPWTSLASAPTTEKIKAIATNLAYVAAVDGSDNAGGHLAEHLAALSRPQLNGALAYLSLTAEAACHAPTVAQLQLLGSWDDQISAARRLSRPEAEKRVAEAIAFSRSVAFDDFSIRSYN